MNIIKQLENKIYNNNKFAGAALGSLILLTAIAEALLQGGEYHGDYRQLITTSTDLPIHRLSKLKRKAGRKFQSFLTR